MRHGDIDLTLVCSHCGRQFDYVGNKWGIPLWAECPDCIEDIPKPTWVDFLIGSTATILVVAALILIHLWR